MMYIYIYIYICICGVFTYNVCIYIYIYIHTYILYTHAYIYTHVVYVPTGPDEGLGGLEAHGLALVLRGHSDTQPKYSILLLLLSLL